MIKCPICNNEIEEEDINFNVCPYCYTNIETKKRDL